MNNPASRCMSMSMLPGKSAKFSGWFEWNRQRIQLSREASDCVVVVGGCQPWQSPGRRHRLRTETPEDALPNVSVNPHVGGIDPIEHHPARLQTLVVTSNAIGVQH